MKIAPKDLVVVVSAYCPCGYARPYIGHIGTVELIETVAKAACYGCRRIFYSTAIALVDLGNKKERHPITTLRKIPPLETEEGIKELLEIHA